MWANCVSLVNSGLCNRRNLMLGTSLFRGSTLYILKTNPNNSFTCFKALCSLHSSNEVNKLLNNNKEVSDKSKKPKKEIKTYITLIGLDLGVSVTTVEEASKLATRRNLKLLKTIDFDSKTSRAVYKLMTDSQYLKEDKEWSDRPNKKDKHIKEDKVVSFSSNIGEHDLQTKIKLMKKWLAKKIAVRVVITGDKMAGETVFQMIEKAIGTDGRIVQKRTKQDVRFQVLPPKKTEEKPTEELKQEKT